MASSHDEKKKKNIQHKKKNTNVLAPKPSKPFKRSKGEAPAALATKLSKTFKKSKEEMPAADLATKLSKTFKKSKEEVPPAPLLVQDDDPDFPRGGGSLLSRQEEAEARAEAEAEFEREENESKNGKGRGKKKGSKRKPSTITDDDAGSLFGEGISGKLPRFANRITLKNISPKMKLWGVIVEVNSKDLVISLPGGLKGFVRAEEVSDIVVDNTDKDIENNVLCRNFRVGQLVSCTVIRVDDDKKEGKGNKRIWLSLRLSFLYAGLTLDAVQNGMVLTAQVKSVEDHGYILHFGVSSISGFLPRSGEDGKFSKGKLLQCVVKSIDTIRGVLHLNADPDFVSKCVAKDLKGLSIDQLIPGMMVNARVLSTLENGIMLSFLTYFTGTVDIFHLQNSFPTGNWKEEYNQHKKVNARILFIDPSTRAVGLTLNSHLVHHMVPPSNVKTGEIYDDCRILRVDRGVGLLLEIPSSPLPSAAYASIFDVADEEILKLEKKFKEGSQVRLRVIGIKHLEGLAMGTLKASAFEGSVFTHSDVKPGILVKAKIIAVESFGAIVQFPSGVKALCPTRHMSELEIVKSSKKFKVGSELLFRVLGCKSKWITVTYKKTLVKSKLTVLASYADAIEGMTTHGWITKIDKHGCFLKFYNGVQGFARRSELGLQPGVEAGAVYNVGQVVKCRIISSVPASHRINISFVISPKRVSQDDVAKVGDVVSGVVERVTTAAVIVHVNGYMNGTISNEHLADHHGQGTILRSALRPGYKFDQLLILDIEGYNLILSAKYSLINHIQEIPADISQIHPLSVFHGYICNVIETGCFVRFLGRLTGFSPKDKVSDGKLDSLPDAFYSGQSVRSHILSVNEETSRIKLSLKQSLCFSTDVSFVQGYFILEEKIARMQLSDVKSSALSWVTSFSIGSVVEGEIQDIKEFGLVLSFKSHADVVGFVANHHLGGSIVEKGSVVKAFVLDISKLEGLVDLSLKPEFLGNAKIEGSNNFPQKKKRQRVSSMQLELLQNVNAVVEVVKENYIVLSIPDYNHAIAYASVMDYNTQRLPNRNFVSGQSVLATVGALPSSDTCGRLLLLLKSSSEFSESSGLKRAKKKSSYIVGSLVEAEVMDIKSLELFLRFGSGINGRVHITEVTDDDYSLENPFGKFRIGQLLNARIVAKAPQSRLKAKGYEWELSVRPSVLEGTGEDITIYTAPEFDFSVGDNVRGYVVKVDSEWVWLTVSRNTRAQLYILDSSCEPRELMEFQNHYKVGQAFKGHIININKEKNLLRLSSRHALPVDHDIVIKDSKKSNVSSVNGPDHILQGDVIGGKIIKLIPGVGGLLVQIGPHLYGRVHYTELADIWEPQPLSGYQEGQFVKCKVLEINRSSDGFVHVDLSLRASLFDIQPIVLAGSIYSSTRRMEKVDDFHPNMEVKGYVKNVTSKGCFIMLSRKVDARIMLTNLSDGYIETPEKEFPVGMLVHGRILSVDSSSKRVDITLKNNTDDASSFSNLQVGDVINGQIRRIEAYGLFIKIDNTNLVGLCHISEVSDDHVENLETKYKAGDKVVAKILKVEEEKHRIKLGMKKSYIGDASGGGNEAENDESADDFVSLDVSSPALQENDILPFTQEIFEEGAPAALAIEESRASVLPLQVSLDVSDGSDDDKVASSKQDNNDVQNVVTKKSDRRAKKKAKEERELEVSACEEHNLLNDIPRTEEEYEKLVRSSPNSSFVWVQYMAFMESLADVEKARSIAERALRTINFREEGEKLNIWTAYFNLENKYGNPSEEAVKKTFHRALQYCDPKKVHMVLLGMYERTELDKLAEELLEKMVKRFKTSCKVWLRLVQILLKHQKDGIQSVVNRALLSLPRQKHIKFISQTAILEFKCGEPDRGRSMFEGILREYPKRTDLWSIYLDQEIRLGNPEFVRALFERVTCLSLPPRKMKFLFTRYLDYEKSQNDKERIAFVTRKAMEFAESLK